MTGRTLNTKNERNTIMTYRDEERGNPQAVCPDDTRCFTCGAQLPAEADLECGSLAWWGFCSDECAHRIPEQFPTGTPSSPENVALVTLQRQVIAARQRAEWVANQPRRVDAVRDAILKWMRDVENVSVHPYELYTSTSEIFYEGREQTFTFWVSVWTNPNHNHTKARIKFNGSFTTTQLEANGTIETRHQAPERSIARWTPVVIVNDEPRQLAPTPTFIDAYLAVWSEITGSKEPRKLMAAIRAANQ